jgi:hypothetical protein
MFNYVKYGDKEFQSIKFNSLKILLDNTLWLYITVVNFAPLTLWFLHPVSTGSTGTLPQARKIFVEYLIQEFWYSCLHYALITAANQKTSHVFAWIWPDGDYWLVNPCALPSIGQTWVFASNDAVFEKGDLIRTLKRLAMESNDPLARTRCMLGWLAQIVQDGSTFCSPV